MSQFQLSKQDLDEIAEMRKRNHLCKFLDNKERFRFTVGDILVKRIQDWDDETRWNTEYVNEATKMAKRYVYVYEDEHGVGFIRSLKVTDGQLGKQIYCMSDFVENETIRFEVDPEFTDSVLLGDGSFDIKAMRQKVRDKQKAVDALDKACRQELTNLKALNDFFAPMTVGSRFYSRAHYKNSPAEFHEIISIKKKYIARLGAEAKDDLSYTFKNPSDLNDSVCYLIEAKDGSGYEEEFYSYGFCDEFLYNNTPPSMEDNL